MQHPLVTILIPVYNASSFLPQCMNSVLSQTYVNLQVVLIDDGSTDNSWSICQGYASNDNRVEIYHQKNQGVAATRNHLLSKVKGDYILFVDADDWMELDMVSFLVEQAISNRAEVVTCGSVINDGQPSAEWNGEVYNQDHLIKEFLYHKTLRGNLWNKLFKAELLKGLYFDDKISYGEDALMSWHAFQRLEKAVVTDRQLYHYRMNEESISHQSFGAKKLSGHRTWFTICEETQREWPQYLHLAQARYGLEDMYLLRLASQDGYKKDEQIRLLQNTVRHYLTQIKKSGLIGLKDTIYAELICKWYGFGRFYYQLHNLFKRQS